MDGLTCSACTRSVEMNIRKLDFVDSVAMSLENTEGKITFKAGKKVTIEKIAQAVFDAGFSVRYLKANFVFDNLTISNGFNWTNENEQYCFVKADNKILNGETVLIFIGEKFMPSKPYKTWKKKIIECCGVIKKKIYYITI
ncbi:MAG: heavy-metal-associated domain-containing protein [Bacteroidetes bacterium]|nr:heavy-metal-associated domain-containing protein [Bacteroidota bacterium]